MSVEYHASEVIDLASAFSEYQLHSGAVYPERSAITDASLILDKLSQAYEALCSEIGGKALQSLGTYESDVSEWKERGLTELPDFAQTHNNWQLAEEPGEMTPLLAPLRVPNGLRGDSFIMNLTLTRIHQVETPVVDEVVREATSGLHAERSIRIVDAPWRSPAYHQGDGSVIFSELLSTRHRRNPQTFGMFIVTDFAERYRKVTCGFPFIGGNTEELMEFSDHVSPEDERTIWLRVHDSYHEIGELPHGQNLALKMHFAPAVLDELKADGSAYLALRGMGSEWAALAARQLIDKMLRFTFSPFSFRSVDGAVGELLLKQSIREGAVKLSDDEMVLDTNALDGTVERLVDDVLQIEAGYDYLSASDNYLHSAGIKLPPDREPQDWRRYATA